jgi:molybdate transport system regulatory protein
MKMSYKAAWDAINEMNTLSPTPIVERATGGRGGGGTRLTERGKEIVAIYRRVEAAQKTFASTLAPYADDLKKLHAFTAKLTVRTSARNQLPATIEKVVLEGMWAYVTLRTAWGAPMRVRITRRSLEELGLSVSSETTVLFKPSWVEWAHGPCRGENCFEGVVETISPEEEMEVAVAPGYRLVVARTSTQEKTAVRIGDAVALRLDSDAALLAV